MTLDRPKLRRPLHARSLEHRGRPFVALSDPLGISPSQVLVPREHYDHLVRHFDGRRSLVEIRERAALLSGLPPATAVLESLVLQLDRAMLLDGPTFGAFVDRDRAEPVRPAAFAGRSYAARPADLRDQLDALFSHPRGSGPPAGPGATLDPGRPLRAVLSPHIDFHRGGPTYTWAYRELIERTDADLFVVLGVAHQPTHHRFVLTRKDFATPLGAARTDRAFVDRLAARAGTHLFDDELVHRGEHSVEFQAIFLRHLLGGRRDFAIVPILVGSFHDLMLEGVEPIDDPEVRRFVEALRSAASASGHRVAYIGGIDLCHVGPEFGDPDRLDDATLDAVRRFDASLLDRAAAGDPAGWFAVAAAVENRYRVCGLAATYTLLHAIGPSRGRLLRYDQAVDPGRTCGVTFASLALEPAP